MFNGEPAIIADHAQAIAEVFSELLVVAIAQSNIAPRATWDVHKGTVFKTTGQSSNRLIDERVLGMGVQNGRTQCINSSKRISAHPHQMRRIKICPNNRANLFAQAQQGRHIVNQLIAVELHSQFVDTMFLCKRCKLNLIGKCPFFPLAFSAMISNPSDVTDFKGLRRFVGTSSSVFKSMCGADVQFAALNSTPLMPSRAAVSSMSSNDRCLSESVTIPIFILVSQIEFWFGDLRDSNSFTCVQRFNACFGNNS
jgi:hypothetical protein